MDGWNIWNAIYTLTEKQNPNATGSEILAVAKKTFNEVMREVNIPCH